jgi:hypothetical protein
MGFKCHRAAPANGFIYAKLLIFFVAVGSFKRPGGRREPPAPTIDRGIGGDSLQSFFENVEKKTNKAKRWGQKYKKKGFFCPHFFA